MRWIFFIAGRYLFNKRKDKGMNTTIFSISGIMIGVAALIVVISIMNGFQLSFVEDLVEISSGHLRIYPDENETRDDIIENIKGLDTIKAIYPVIEDQAIVMADFADPQGLILRCIPPDAFAADEGLNRQLEVISGTFDLTGSDSIVIGSILANYLRAGLGSTVELFFLTRGSLNDQNSMRLSFTVTGIVKSGYYDIDRSFAFLSINTAIDSFAQPEDIFYLAKLGERFDDKRAEFQIQELAGQHVEIESWREYNSSFFGALRMEKTVMIILLCLIFLVVGVSIYHALQRSVYERTEEIGLLRAVGGRPSLIQTIFILEGLLLGMLGSVLGAFLGMLIVTNIDLFNLYSSDIFYLPNGTPFKILFEELLFVCMFAIISTTLAAYWASKRIFKITPAEVLKYE